MKKRRARQLALIYLLSGQLTCGWAGSPPAATLPVPCVNGSCGKSGPTTWVTQGSATGVSSNNTLTVNQSSNQVTLNWLSFNVSGNGKVVFDQPSATSIALNQIFQASPSSIFGSIQANGQIYLINANGIIFGTTASVNAAGILAGTLSIPAATFEAGLLSPAVIQSRQPAMSSDGRTDVLDDNGNPVLGPDGQPIPVAVTVDPGAKLSTTGSGGRILLAGQNVTNGGSLSAPGGQVIVAAGSALYLAPSTDPSLRGLLVEVDQGGTAWNQLTGNINTPQGNTTLVGLAVNQDGRISASTSVTANGSVQLLAQDTVSFDGTSTVANRSGSVTLGAGSSIETLPDIGDPATAVADQTQLTSSITISGEQVHFESGSQIVAPNGQLTVTATGNPNPTVQPVPDPNSSIRIDPGVSIDLAGSVATLPMSANLLTVQLNATELADDPQQRNGPLHGQYVTVNINQGTPLANISSDIAAIPETIAQRTETGGSASFNSAGDLVVAQGATLNVSGGASNYLGGTIATTQLVEANGTTVSIGEASPSQIYTGIINAGYTVKSNNWGVIQTIPNDYLGQYVPGYEQGASAGSLQFSAPGMVLAGTLIGQTTVGPNQRTPSSAPAGGQLILGLASPDISPLNGANDYRLPSVTFTSGSPQVAIADGASLPPTLPLQLPTAYLANGFTSTTIYSNGTVEVPAGTPLNLQPDSRLTVFGNNIDINSSIFSPGGALQFTAILTQGIAGITLPPGGVSIGNDVTLDVRGNWTNDFLTASGGLLPTSLVDVNGGSIALAIGPNVTGGISIGSNDDFELSGGAWLERNASIVYGNGGSLSIVDNGVGNTFQIGSHVGLDAFGTATAPGGSISLEASNIDIQALPAAAGWQLPAAPAGVLSVGSSLFSDYGFASVALTANGAPVSGSQNVITVNAGTPIQAISESLVLNPGFLAAESASDVLALSQVTQLPQASRTPMTVALTASPSTYSGILQPDGIAFGQGASLTGDPGSSFTLSTVNGSIDVAGSITAPSGSINLLIQSPNFSSDPGYQPNVGITLAPTATLSVAGTTVLQPGYSALLLGTVLPGGSVTLQANRGFVDVLAGSTVDVQGASGALDIQSATGYSRTQIGSAAGSATVSAAQSISWLGTLLASAGLGDTGQADAGSLTVALTNPTDDYLGFPAGTRTVELINGPAPAQILPPDSLQALVSVPMLQAAGIDKLVLSSPVGAIDIDAGVNLLLGRELDLEGSVIEVAKGGAGSATVGAPYVLVGYPEALTNPGVSSSGLASLTVKSDFLDLEGSVIFSGLANVDLDSAEDVRLLGFQQDGSSVGSLTTTGNLTIGADRIYPATLTSFSITALGSDGSVTLDQTGASLGTPLSVAGAVSVTANRIQDSGTLLVPFGTVTFNAADSLTFASGSLTSVSADNNLLLFGSVIDGQWQYNLAGTVTNLNTLPSRAIQITSPTVTIAKGATLDVSGGGDLYAYEWTPGTGGTTDVLSPSVTPGLYAIIPALEGQLAPFDPQEYTSSTLAATQSVYLTGVPGLPAGYYPLLPARYALLPGSGALLVSAVPGSAGIPLGTLVTLPNGGVEVAGYYATTGTTLHDPVTTGFEILPGSYASQLADYTNFTASSYLRALQSATPGSAPLTLPADGGTLTFNVTQALNAAGTVLAAGASGGNGALIALSAPSLSLTATGVAAPAPGVVQIATDVLQSWNPGELVLGGTLSTDGQTLTVTAGDITLKSGASLSLDNVVLAASGNITLDPGASIASPGQASAGLGLLPAALNLAGNGAAQAAFLDVANDSYVVPVRPAVAGSAAPGTITLSSGSTLSSNGAVVIDAPGGGTLAGSFGGSGTRWSLGANEIDLASGPDTAAAFEVTPAVQAVLQAGSALRLAADTIDIDNPVNISSPSLQSLVLDTSDLRNLAGGATSTFAAGSLIVQGLAATAPGPQLSPAGTLDLSGHTLQFGPGNITIDGFQTVNATSSGDLLTAGNASVDVSENLTLTAGRVLASSDAQTTLTAGGTLAVQPSGGASASQAGAPLGGSLVLSASQVDLGGTIMLPSGNLTVEATNGIDVSSAALLSVAGAMVSVNGRTLGSMGGTMQLTSGGTVAVAPGATLSVAGAGTNNAGAAQIFATGAAQLDGTFDGQAGTGGSGGSFQLVANSLDSFSGLNNALQTGGFSSLRSIDLGSGDIDLAAGSTLTAQTVLLVAETGAVNIGGTISAPSSGNTQSSIQLYGANGVTLQSGGQLLANATGGALQGGNLTIGTTAGSIDLQPGSVIAALGAAQDGTLTLRAPATATDVAITEIASNTAGLAQVSIEPVNSFAISSAPSDSDLATIYSQVSAYVSAAAPTILGRLQTGAGAPLVINPGIELDATGDVTLGSLDLSTWQFNGNPGIFTVRATGSVTVNGTLSDGFQIGSNDLGNPLVVPLTTPSSTIQLIAGANLASPNPLGTVAGSGADLTLAPGTIVRTGTGAIDLIASQDVVFQTGASVYTGGLNPAGTNPIEDDPVGTANFMTAGGDIVLSAGRDVVATFVTQNPTDWQIRGLPALNPEGGAFWGVDPTNFGFALGTFGGGDITVTAGRNIQNLSAAAADSGQATPAGTLQEFGGGSLSVTAGNDIDTGYFYVAEGSGLIQAGNQLGSDVMSGPSNLGTMLLLGSAQVGVRARGDVLLESAANPTVLTNPEASAQGGAPFFTYGTSSLVYTESDGGTVQIVGNSGTAGAFLTQQAESNGAQAEFPSNLYVRAFSSGIDLNVATIALYPSTNGQLDLFASQGISGGFVVLSDAPPSSVGTPLTPTLGLAPGLALSAQGAIHGGDPVPVQITAGGTIDDSYFSLAKPADISVGGNLIDTTVVAQNLNPTDVTQIDVAGSLEYPTSAIGRITVGGPGELEILVGGQLNLGFSEGITTTGRLDDPQIQSTQGASIIAAAGLQAGSMDIGDFMSDVVAPSSTYQAQLISYVTPAGLTTSPTFSQALQLFAALGPSAQREFVVNTFFAALVEAGRLANTSPGSDFAGGYAAIDALFPGSRGSSNPYSGDITLDFSQIYTLQGGSISLLAPGGGVNVGLAVAPAGLEARLPSQLGIVAQGAGNVQIFADENVLVNASRIFTLGGGNIAIWSTFGNIDAGRGAKGSVSAPPPVILVDAAGNVTEDFSGAVAGSGIRTIITEPGQAAGDVDLVAPVGYVNAGDAGIGSAGNLNIAAHLVLGTQNISVGGVATGVPPEVSGIGATLSGASSAGSSSANTSAAAAAESAGQQVATASQSAMSWLEVFVLGVGEENCDPKDLECLKRQKPSGQ